jgi:hypothetical protein
MTIMRPNGAPDVLAAETYWSAKRTGPSGPQRRSGAHRRAALPPFVLSAVWLGRMFSPSARVADVQDSKEAP